MAHRRISFAVMMLTTTMNITLPFVMTRIKFPTMRFRLSDGMMIFQEKNSAQAMTHVPKKTAHGS